jgi:hypothetical protein
MRAISATPTATSSTPSAWDNRKKLSQLGAVGAEPPFGSPVRGSYLPMRVPAEEFRALDLEVHSFLAGVALRDVSAIDLPGGGPDRSISDVRALLFRDSALTATVSLRVLFSLRLLLGRLFGWDRRVHEHAEDSYLNKLSDDQRGRSLADPGTSDGTFRLLYLFPKEVLGEVRNATVHAFSCMTIRRTASGYRFYWAIYVKNVSRFTPVYMALIEPFRRLVVYPAILRRLRDSWLTTYPSPGDDDRAG